MYRVLAILFVLMISIFICVRHGHIQRTLTKLDLSYYSLLRSAAEHSIAASNSVDCVLALISIIRAEEITKTMIAIYGLKDESLGIDIGKMNYIIHNQKSKILKDCLHLHHPLSSVMTTPVEPTNTPIELPEKQSVSM
jgi:hypothetical protein